MYPSQNEPPLYFLHIPKTAGGTLINILDDFFDQKEIFPALLLSDLLKTPALLDNLEKHRLFRGHFDYMTASLFRQPPQIITMLRQPIERTLSQIEHTRLERGVLYWDQENRVDRLGSMSDFLASPGIDLFLGNIQTRSFVSEWYGLPHLNYWDITAPIPPDNFLIELAKVRLQNCHFIGIQERFWDSARLLCFTFGFRLPPNIKNRNVSKARIQADQLSASELERLNELNNLDVLLYEYGKSLFRHRFQEMASYLSETYPQYMDLDRQLHEHYKQVSLAKNTPVRSVFLDFGQAIPGTGWYPVEQNVDLNINFRWSGPGILSTVEAVLLSDCDMVVEFRIIYSIAQDIIESLELIVNDEKVSLSSRYDDQQCLIFRGSISQWIIAKQAGFCELTFRVIRTQYVKGNDPNDLDSRAVGLAYSWLRIEPVEG